MINVHAESPVFPQQVPVDPVKVTRALFVPSDSELYGPTSIVDAFQPMDDIYSRDRLGTFQFMAKNVMRLGVVDAEFLYDEADADSKDILLVMSPLNDGRPESPAESIDEYARLGDISKGDAQPNSWGPSTKLWIDYQLGRALGNAMPRLQIFSRDIPALSRAERRQIASGDMLPFGRLAEAGLQAANEQVYKRHGKRPFERVHVFSAGMGSKGLGAATHLAENTDYEVGAVTLMNLAINTDNVTKMMGDYMTRRTTGDAADIVVPDDWTKIIEPLIRREVDGRGAEFAMRVRNVKAMLNVLATKAIMNSARAPQYIERLMEHGATVTVANATNESMVRETSKSLPGDDEQFRYVSIVGVEGKKVGMMTNEHAGLVAMVSNLGITNHLRRSS